MVGASRKGWRSFNKEVKYFSSHFRRPHGENAIHGDDPSIMFFTSGTTSYPKITTHNFKYPLGHYVTAKYWHQVDPDGIHFAISDTGWGKALWGKIYGQWLCEACIFTYDFDNFDAKEILHMIEKYKITTSLCTANGLPCNGTFEIRPVRFVFFAECNNSRRSTESGNL